MLQGYTYTQALRMYRKHGVRVAVPLSTAAKRIAQQRANNASGLRELAAAQLPGVHRGFMQSDQEFAAELLAMRCNVAEGMYLEDALAMHGFATRVVA